MKPRIAIDTSFMDRRLAKGTAIVIRHSVTELLKYRNEFDITLIHREAVPEDPLYKEFKEIIIPKIPVPKWSNFISELVFFLSSRERFDLYYFPYSRIYPTFWLAPAKKIVFAIFDGGPQTAGYKGRVRGLQPWWVRIFFGRIDLFVVLTEFGRKGVVDTYHLPIEKIRVLPNGVDSRFRSMLGKKKDQTAHSKYGIPNPYILCVSRFDPHKNIIRLLEAFAELIKDVDVKEHLVFVGGRHMPDYSLKVEETIRKLKLSNRVHVAEYVDDADLPNVYAAASLAVFPSLYEGFGLPVIEAMSSKTPLVISNIDALVEVSGGYAEIVDPYSVEEITMGMKRALTASLEQERRIELGKEYVSKYTWEEHGSVLVDIFRSLTKHHAR